MEIFIKNCIRIEKSANATITDDYDVSRRGTCR